MKNLRGVVGQIRRDDLVFEYVRDDAQGELALTPEPVIHWTQSRPEALELDWDEAGQLAKKIGFPAHAIVSPCTTYPARKKPRISPEDAYRINESRNLA